MDSPEFTLSQVAAAAGVEVNTLRSWLQRKHWKMDTTVESAGDAGKAHLITLRRGLHIGLAVELVRNDMDPARAFKAAYSFSHTAAVDRAQPAREVGGLYDYPAMTVMVVPRATSDSRILRIDDKSSAFDLFATYPSTVIVSIKQVDQRIRNALGGK